MLVQEHIREHGLDSLKEKPFFLAINEYPEEGLVTLNYNQIDSPKNDPIIKECRGLILDSKNNWNVVARSFDRFFNFGECQKYSPELYPVSDAIVMEKLDGTLITAYWFNGKWNISTRKMAFAEGGTKFDSTYKELFDKTVDLSLLDDWIALRGTSIVFELTSPENRIVTPYSEYKSYLLAARDEDGNFYNFDHLKQMAKILKVDMPKLYSLNSIEEVIRSSKELPAIEEGYVCVWPDHYNDHYRLKIKNPSYMAIANLRCNGELT